MQKRLMDILADPDNPEIWPLKLKVFKSETRKREKIPSMHESTDRFCKFYCFRNNKLLVSDPLDDKLEKTLPQEEIDKLVTKDDCLECFNEEVIDGIIYHDNTEMKWFMVDREIAVMLPLELREKQQEIDFIKKYTEQCKEMGIEEPFYNKEN